MMDLDEQLQHAGAQWRAEQSAPEVDFDRAMRPVRHRSRVLVAVAAGVIAVGVVVAFLERDTGSQVSVTPTTTIAPRRVIELNSAISRPTTLAVANGRIWVGGYARANGVSNPAHLQEIDATSGEVIGDVTLPDDSPSGLRIGAGAVWLNAQQKEESAEVLKIDTATHAIAKRIPNSASGQVAITEDAVWASDGVGGVRRIDPATGRIVATIDLPRAGIYPAGWVTSGASGLWVGNGYDGAVYPIDTATNTAGPAIRVVPDLSGMVEANGALWVRRANANQVVAIVGGRAARTIDLGERTLDMVTDGQALWFGTEVSYLLRVDTETGVITRVALPAGTQWPTLAVDPASGTVWAATATPTPRLIRVGAP